MGKVTEITFNIETDIKGKIPIDILNKRLLKTRHIKNKIRNTISNSKITSIYRKTKGKCFYCGKGFSDIHDENFTIDHYIPKSKGGNNHSDNLVPACLKCNSDKADKMPDEFNAK